MVLSAAIEKVVGASPFIARVTKDHALPVPLRHSEILLAESNDYDAEGFLGTLRVGSRIRHSEICLPPELSYLDEGDIIRVNAGAGSVRVLYRQNSPHNVLFFTERCNSRCLMCSQPPRDVEDGFLVDEILEAIPLMSTETKALCITGGEPMLVGPKVFDVMASVKHFLPDTALHMLSNGRLFAEGANARALASVQHPDFMIGVPLYADVASVHDFVVQAKGAYNETIRGLLNLARHNVRVEIRFVIHKQTVGRMVETAKFITRNLPFVSHVALMGLEMTGFTKANLEALWIDPFDYQSTLRAAVEELASARLRTSIYNLPLCIVPQEVWPYARKSISDWKNMYLPVCEPCQMKDECAGFFASASVRHSANIRPFHTKMD